MPTITMRFYYHQYDTQGGEFRVNTDDFDTRDDWEKFRQKKLQEFMSNYEFSVKIKGRTYTFRSRKEFEEWGKYEGTYSDNVMNRRLGRAGRSYSGDRGYAVRKAIEDVMRKRVIPLSNEDKALDMMYKARKYKPYKTREDKYILEQYKKGRRVDAIAKRLFRSRSAIYGRKYKLVKGIVRYSEKLKKLIERLRRK